MKPGSLNPSDIDLGKEDQSDVADCRMLVRRITGLLKISEDSAVKYMIREIRAAETRGQLTVMRAAARAATHAKWDSRDLEALTTKI